MCFHKWENQTTNCGFTIWVFELIKLRGNNMLDWAWSPLHTFICAIIFTWIYIFFIFLSCFTQNANITQRQKQFNLFFGTGSIFLSVHNFFSEEQPDTKHFETLLNILMCNIGRQVLDIFVEFNCQVICAKDLSDARREKLCRNYRETS